MPQFQVPVWVAERAELQVYVMGIEGKGTLMIFRIIKGKAGKQMFLLTL